MSSANFDFGGWLESARVGRILNDALRDADDGELYLQTSQSERLSFGDGRLLGASFGISQGFGLRSICGDLVAYAHANKFDEAALGRAADAVRLAQRGRTGSWDVSPPRKKRPHYADVNPVDSISFEAKLDLLSSIDAYARSKDPRIFQVGVSVSGSQKLVNILRPGEQSFSERRSNFSLGVTVTAREKGRTESGHKGIGGRYRLEDVLAEEVWHSIVDEAIRQADVNLRSVDAPAGAYAVVLGPGWPGVMLHEAVGHGLEGDAIRKDASVYAGRLGQQVAAPGVTVVDNGTLPHKRGSMNFDDEGTPTQETVLIEDGRLVAYMQDRLNARLMGQTPTGNGRRQSYASAPMPRMTNTYMREGKYDPNEILASVREGIYAVDFGGGQVDTISGNFVFSCREAYRIRNGVLQEPIKGATLIGNGPEAMRRISMVGNDLALDDGIATCGKEGQDVLVGVGQPTIRLDEITIGGTQ